MQVKKYQYSLHRSNVGVYFKDKSNCLIVEGNGGNLKVGMYGSDVLFGEQKVLIKSLTSLRYFKTIVRNMVMGVSDGYFIELQCVGLGYRFVLLNKVLVMKLGYCNYIRCAYKVNVHFVGHRDKLLLYGLDLNEVRRYANLLKQLRIPDAYKGKGIRYAGENIVLRIGKQK